MKVAFCGNGKIKNTEEVRAWLYKEIEGLIQLGADTFLLSGNSSFEKLAASVVWELKKKFPHTQAVLVKLYANYQGDERYYDWTVSPNIKHVSMHYVISELNKYMVDKSDIVVCFQQHLGNASKIFEYMYEKKKRVITYKQDV